MIKVRIESGLCCGFGNCALVCPAVFEVDAVTNTATLVGDAAAVEKFAAEVRRAASECPSQAILIDTSEDTP